MSEARRLYESLSEEFIRKGIASNRFSELEKLYHLASDNEKLQPQWRELNRKTISQLQAELTTANKRIEILEGALNAALGFIDGMYISFKNPEIKDIYNFCKQALEKSAELKKRVEEMENE